MSVANRFRPEKTIRTTPGWMFRLLVVLLIIPFSELLDKQYVVI